jgi:hypothetical protein
MKIGSLLAHAIVVCAFLSNCMGVYALPIGSLSAIEIKEKIIKQSLVEGVEPALSLSMVKQESNFDTGAKSYVGAIGLFQLMPQTAEDLGVNPYSVNENIKGGIKYIKMLKNQFGSNELALAAYNAGPGAVQKHNGIPPYGETRVYVHNIMKSYKTFKNNPDPMIEKLSKEMDDEKDVINNSIQTVLEVNATKSNQDNKLTLLGYLFKMVNSVFS